MFATDRDLLVMEPALWQEIAWAAQTRARTTGSIGAGTGILTTPSINLASLGIEPGHVAIVDGVPLEVIARLSATTASVSLLRASADGPPIFPGAVTGASVVLSTFSPQLGLAHTQILRLAGIEPAASSDPHAITEAHILNPRDATLLECLGALHLIYAGAAASGHDKLLLDRTQTYRDRFAHERRRLRLLLDLDRDGLPDAQRALGVAHLVRA